MKPALLGLLACCSRRAVKQTIFTQRCQGQLPLSLTHFIQWFNKTQDIFQNITMYLLNLLLPKAPVLHRFCSPVLRHTRSPAALPAAPRSPPRRPLQRRRRRSPRWTAARSERPRGRRLPKAWAFWLFFNQKTLGKSGLFMTCQQQKYL